MGPSHGHFSLNLHTKDRCGVKGETLKSPKNCDDMDEIDDEM